MVLSNFTPSTVIPQLGATPVFPVKWNAKTPLTKRGFLDASADPHQIEQWQREFPGCNWGAPTGIDFVVLDLDAKHPDFFE
jgi:Bifunctional DNA primase/polymerase, N-terminal